MVQHTRPGWREDGFPCVSHRACEVNEKCVGSAPPTCRDLFLTLIMRLPISAQLRSAARDLGMLPEIAMASRMRSKLDFVGARGQLERASEVVSGVPMPEMQLLSGGALARMLEKQARCVRRCHCGMASSNAVEMRMQSCVSTPCTVRSPVIFILAAETPHCNTAPWQMHCCHQLTRWRFPVCRGMRSSQPIAHRQES